MSIAARRSPWLGEGTTVEMRRESDVNGSGPIEAEIASGRAAVVITDEAHRQRERPGSGISGSGPLLHQWRRYLLAHAARFRRAAATGPRGCPGRLLIRLEVRRVLQLLLGHRDL